MLWMVRLIIYDFIQVLGPACYCAINQLKYGRCTGFLVQRTFVSSLLLIDLIAASREFQRFIPEKRHALPKLFTHFSRQLPLHFTGDHQLVHGLFPVYIRRGYICVNSVALFPGPGCKVIRQDVSSGRQYPAYAQ